MVREGGEGGGVCWALPQAALQGCFFLERPDPIVKGKGRFKPAHPTA